MQACTVIDQLFGTLNVCNQPLKNYLLSQPNKIGHLYFVSVSIVSFFVFSCLFITFCIIFIANTVIIITRFFTFNNDKTFQFGPQFLSFLPFHGTI